MATQQTKQQCNTIYSNLWGSYLLNKDYTPGHLIEFSSLWPDATTFADTYAESLGNCCYELCKLLLVSNSVKYLEVLLDKGHVAIDRCFGQASGITFAHLACALGSQQAVVAVLKRGSNVLWTHQDDEGRTPADVCFSPELKAQLPSLPSRIAPKKRPLHGGSSVRAKIFLHATQPDKFYQMIVELQEYKFDVNNERDERGNLLVHVVTSQGLTALPAFFVLKSYNADFNARNKEGRTPLSIAAQMGDEKLVNVLICVFGGDMSQCDDLQWTPLHYAAVTNHPSTIHFLLRRGADSGCEDFNKCDPLILASNNGHMECVQVLENHRKERTQRLSKEAETGSLIVSKLTPSDICEINEDGHTLLMVAVLSNRQYLVRQLLLQPNCPVNYIHTKGSASTYKTAVLMSAERGHTECLNELILKKANVTIKDGNMWLPLHYATWNGFMECVNAILCVPDHQGLTGLNLAIGLAQASQRDEILAVLTTAFKERQATVVRPILFETCVSGEKDRLVEVLEEGDEVNPLNPNGEWPVLLAAAAGQVGIIEHLHQFGGVVTYLADSASTPLHQASERGHMKVVEYLLQFYPPPHLHKVSEGKDINRRDSSHATALELAALNGHSEIVELLLAHGALSSLPDSRHHFVGSEQFAGVQHTLDSHRRLQFSKLSHALKSNITVDDFMLIWAGPSDFNLYTRSGSNVLMLAAQNTHAEIVTFLVQEAKKLTSDMMMDKISVLSMDSTSIYEDEEGVAKIEAAPQGDFPNDDGGQKSAEWIQSFVLHRQNLYDGQTALHRAVLGDKCDNACVLLTLDPQGANIQDWEGNTPLHMVCRRGKKEMLRVFLGFSCVDVNIRNKDGLLPEGCAISQQRYFKKEFEKHRKLAMSHHSAPGTTKPKLRLPTPPLTTKQDHGSTTGSEEAPPTFCPPSKATPLSDKATPPSHPPSQQTAGSNSQVSGDEQFTMSMFDEEMKRLKAELASKLTN